MKKFLKIILCLLPALVLTVGAYAAYVLIDYDRLEDMLVLETANPFAPEARTEDFEILKAGEEKRILSWNIGFGAYTADYSFFMDGGREARARTPIDCEFAASSVMTEAENTGADFVLVQEVDEYGTRSHHVNQRAMLESGKPLWSTVFAQNYDSSYLFYPFHQPIGANRSGMMTMSRFEIESALRRSLPVEGGFNKFFDLDRCYSVSRIPVDNGKTLCLYNLHLSAYTSDGSIATEQLAILLEDMAAEYAAGNYVIAGGDFNKDLWGDSSVYTGIPITEASWAQPFPMELLPEGIILVDSLNPEKPVASCRDAGEPYMPGKTFTLTLDGFMISDNVELVSCGVLDRGFAVSDHNPVVMDFILKI